jgi:thiol-disulfide isomerase/thioredoxin
VKKKSLILLIVISFGIIIALISVKPARSPKITAVGSAAPDFELVDLSSNRIRLADLKGSVVFINFWATWCTSCIDEMPSIQRLSGILPGNAQFKIITILYKDDLRRATGYLRQNGYTFPVFLNPDESAAKVFGITGVPETFILDKKGILRHKVIGPAEWDSPGIIQKFQTLINEP